jgi:pyruvate formate lyase activating enzyme
MSANITEIHDNHKILLTNIQRFSLHDGPGIRTTVFLKGCSLHCPWCSNPENISKQTQYYIKNGIKDIYGHFYTPDELYQEVIKDSMFYRCNRNEYSKNVTDKENNLPGGVTFSGGECLLQIGALLPLCEKLMERNIHIAVETSLFVPQKNVEIAIQKIDFFYVDVKILNSERCKLVLNGNLARYLSNLDILLHSKKPVVIRVPVIGGYTDSLDNRNAVIDLIEKYVKDENTNLLKIELIKEYDLGIPKYLSLAFCNKGYDIPNFKGVSDDLMESYKGAIIERIEGKIPVEICKI